MAQSASLTAARLSKSFAALAALSEKQFHKKHPHAVDHFAGYGTTLGNIRYYAGKLLASGALAGFMVLSPGTVAHVSDLASHFHVAAPLNPRQLQEKLVTQLSGVLPIPTASLTAEQEHKVSAVIADTFGITAVPELDGIRLNHSWGYMGAEQHLPRYPGDHVGDHDAIQKAGITPGKSAWGYFAHSRAHLTNDIYLSEKYYIAVQTLYMPEWNTNTKILKDWFKFRKMIAINPTTGKSIVVVVGDAGPAKWTGKQFGGSPEVMEYLGYNVGKKKGAVILFFIDDPDDIVPLGPLEYNVKSDAKTTVI